MRIQELVTRREAFIKKSICDICGAIGRRLHLEEDLRFPTGPSPTEPQDICFVVEPPRYDRVTICIKPSSFDRLDRNGGRQCYSVLLFVTRYMYTAFSDASDNALRLLLAQLHDGNLGVSHSSSLRR